MPIDKFGHVLHDSFKEITEPKNDDRVAMVMYIEDAIDEVKKYMKKNYVDLLEYNKHIDAIPFIVTSDGDLHLKPKTVVNEATGVTSFEKRKVKNIGYPGNNEDSTHRKFVVDSINRKFGELFSINKDGDIVISEFTSVDGAKRRRKILNYATGGG